MVTVSVTSGQKIRTKKEEGGRKITQTLDIIYGCPLTRDVSKENGSLFRPKLSFKMAHRECNKRGESSTFRVVWLVILEIGKGNNQVNEFLFASFSGVVREAFLKSFFNFSIKGKRKEYSIKHFIVGYKQQNLSFMFLFSVYIPYPRH